MPKSTQARIGWAAAALVAVVVVVGAIALASGGGDDDDSGGAADMSLRIGWTSTPSNIPIQIAQDRGFYKKYGLDVSLTANPASGGQLPSLGKQYDILVGTIGDVLLFAGKGGDPIVLASGQVDTGTTADDNLLVDPSIKSLQDLRGKTVGSIAVGQGQQYVSAVIALDKAGIDPDDVHFVQVPFPNQLDALRSKRIDAALAVQPFINQIKGAGYRGLANTLLAVGDEAPGALYVAKQSRVEDNPEAYEAFQKAFTDATNWCKANREACIAEVVKVLNVPEQAAQSTPIDRLTPKPKNQWMTDWIKPMEDAGLLKRGVIDPDRNFVFDGS